MRLSAPASAACACRGRVCSAGREWVLTAHEYRVRASGLALGFPMDRVIYYKGERLARSAAYSPPL